MTEPKRPDQTPRYSVTKDGNMFRVFDRKKRRIVARGMSLEAANRMRDSKEKSDP